MRSFSHIADYDWDVCFVQKVVLDRLELAAADGARR